MEPANTRELTTDYLIIGAGAVGMAFADEIIHHAKNARVILVDRRAGPGGHWNDAYDFVRLHQPSLFYGVNSEPLGEGGNDLASKDELLEYFQRVKDKLEATGRATFYFQCEYRGEGRFVSLTETAVQYHVTVRKRLVDGTYLNIQVPATQAPKYAIAEEVASGPINVLAHPERAWARHVVIGAGKTGMDAILYLLAQGADPDTITWIVSNDAWLINRDNITTEVLSYDTINQLRIIAQGESARAVLLQNEADGRFMRLDESVWPTKFRCATVNPAELAQLRRIRNVVRLGRVQRIDPDAIVLEKGAHPTDGDTLHVDCTADGLARRPQVPIFSPGKITLQPIFMCHPTFSAAGVAAIELRFKTDAERNKRCPPVPHPERPEHYFEASKVTIASTIDWGPNLAMRFRGSRLCWVHHFPFWVFWKHVLGMFWWRGRALAKMGPMAKQLVDEKTPE